MDFQPKVEFIDAENEEATANRSKNQGINAKPLVGCNNRYDATSYLNGQSPDSDDAELFLLGNAKKSRQEKT